MCVCDKFGRKFCGCCGDADAILTKTQLFEDVNNDALFNIINNYGFCDLNDDGKKMVLMCLYFLYLEKEDEEYVRGRKTRKGPTPCGHIHDAYIALWSFIYDYLKVTNDYDYWLMNWLDWNLLIEHGSGIRCSWLSGDGRELIVDNIDLVKLERDNIIKWMNEADP